MPTDDEDQKNDEAEDRPQYPPYPAIDPADVKIIRVNKTANTNKKQAEIIEKALKRGKRHFGAAAGSLTWMDSPKLKDNLPEGWKHEVVDLAMEAERRTTKTLLEWMKDKPATVLIDSCHIPGVGKETVDQETGLIEGGDTDHLLVIGSNVYVIDTKFWKRKAMYTVGDDGQVLRGGKSFPGGNVNINKAIHMWFDYIDSDDAELSGAIYIDSDDKYDPKTESWSTTVYRNRNWYKNLWFLVEPRRFKDWLDSKYVDQDGYNVETGEEGDPGSIRTIDTSIITQLAVTCVKPYNRADGLINMKAFKI